MSVPFDRIVEAFKLGADARRDSDAPVRVDVRVDSSATPALVDIIRRALVPQTTNALVRVGRLSDREPVRSDTDVVIVITCGSDGLEDSVRDLVVYGCPVVVVAESSVEVPFITYDAPMLGLVSATDECHLLSELAGVDTCSRSEPDRIRGQLRLHEGRGLFGHRWPGCRGQCPHRRP